jgi:hypothetical protein
MHHFMSLWEKKNSPAFSLSRVGMQPWVVLSGYSGSSTTKTGRYDIAEILLNVALNAKNQSI